MDIPHIDPQAAAFARKNRLVSGDAIDPIGVLDMLEERERQGHPVKCPASFLKAMSHEGSRFSSLAEFPRGVLLRVCHNSSDGTFRVGDIVWRDKDPLPSGLDGINFWRESACLDAEFCDAALVGAQFERTTWVARNMR